MDRRQLLKSLGAAACIGASSLPFKSFSKSSVTTAVNYKSLFAKALANTPKLIGYSGVEQDLYGEAITVEGKLPLGLNGRFFRNGPARLERGQLRYKHLFEGDGMVQEFILGNGAIKHRGKFVKTPKFTQEQASSSFLYSGPDTQLTPSLAITKADDINVANTSILPVGSDLWALWEAGSASKLNGSSLEFEQFVNLGKDSNSKQMLKGMPFSAHPKVMANGEIWNFGYSPTGHIIVYQLSKLGQLVKFNVIKTDFVRSMKHDFLITENYVLLILPSISPTTSGEYGIFSKLNYDASRPFTVLVVDKNTLTVARRYELDPAFAFHFGNAWEDKDGHIHFDASLYPNLDVLHQMSDLMAGEIPTEDTNAKPALVTLYKNGQSDVQVLNLPSEFPRVVQQRTGLVNQHLYFLSCDNKATWHDSICQLDLPTGKVTKYNYGDDFIVEEHVPISVDGNEQQTYLMGTALHVPSQRTCLNVFNANALNNGPLFRAWLPYNIPLGFHGQFVPA